MKIRGSGKKAEKIEPQMVPMIDIVFQLLIFFMLTLKIVAQEGDFNINMPIGTSGAPSTTIPNVIRVHLVANEDGTLGNILFMNRPLGVGDAAYETLNNEIRNAVGFANGKPLKDDVEVEIEADYNLHYRYTLQAVSACTGTIQKTTDGDRLFRYVEKIKFAPPKRPADAT